MGNSLGARIDAQSARIDALADRVAIHIEQHRA